MVVGLGNKRRGGFGVCGHGLGDEPGRVALCTLDQFQLAPGCPAHVQRPVTPRFDEGMGRNASGESRRCRAHRAIEVLMRMLACHICLRFGL